MVTEIYNITKKKLIKVLKSNNYHQRRTAEYFCCSRIVIRDRINKYNIKWNKQKTFVQNVSNGLIGVNLGIKRKPFSDETKRRMSESAKKKTFSKLHRINLSIANTGKKLSKETIEKLKISHTKSFNKVQNQVKHKKIIKIYGKANCCENIDCKNKNPKVFDWANINHQYNENKKEWIQLCRSCHMLMDRNKIKIKRIAA